MKPEELKHLIKSLHAPSGDQNTSSVRSSSSIERNNSARTKTENESSHIAPSTSGKTPTHPPKKNNQPMKKTTEASAASHTYDHYAEKWGKFDIDAALKSDDEQGNANSRSNTNKTPPKDHEYWKDQGNKLFKSGNFTEAYKAYTRSIHCTPTSIAYANRAMASLKLANYISAEEDCSNSILLDPSYVKAYLRRGTARKSLENTHGALSDYETALRYEPTNKNAQDERRCLITAAMKEHGVSAPIPEKVTNIGVDLELDGAIANGSSLRVVDNVVFGREADIGIAKETKKTEVMHRKKKNAGIAVVHPLGDDDGMDDYIPPLLLEKEKGEEKHCIDSHNDADNKHICSGSRKIEIKPTSRELKMKAPKTGVEFEKGWRECKGSLQQQAEYLCLLDSPSQLPLLLKQALTPVLLEGLLKTVLSVLVETDLQSSVQILEMLPKIPRFEMNVLSLSSKQKKEIGVVWDNALQIESLVNGDKAILKILKSLCRM